MSTSPAASRLALFLLAVVAALGCFGRPVLAATPAEAMIEFSFQGQKVEAAPISWNTREVHLLGRDGRLLSVDPAHVSDFTKSSAEFRVFSPSEFRAELMRELGDGYEVSGTSHYLVAHPRGQGEKWAERFEDLYRSFVHFFSVRGMEPAPPQFPLVGIVCRDRAEFVRHAAAQGDSVPSGVVGYYNIGSNRINLYDMGAKADSANWRQNAGVLIHEATHQSAFNTGIHSRYCPPPLWLAEGLAMLFEAPGVYDSHSFTRPADRVNRDRLRVFRKELAAHHRPEILAALVASDDLFRANPMAAYAESWAFSFFLVETEPQKYLECLKRTASRPPFQEYTAGERTADFTAIFGSDWRMLEARFLRFMAEVP
jgi:hypothetical protein